MADIVEELRDGCWYLDAHGHPAGDIDVDGVDELMVKAATEIETLRGKVEAHHGPDAMWQDTGFANLEECVICGDTRPEPPMPPYNPDHHPKRVR